VRPISLSNSSAKPATRNEVSSRAYEISSQTRHGFYDCLYVALAEREGCELLTADQRLINNLGPVFPFIKSLASLP